MERASGLPCRHSWRHPLNGWQMPARKRAWQAGGRLHGSGKEACRKPTARRAPGLDLEVETKPFGSNCLAPRFTPESLRPAAGDVSRVRFGTQLYGRADTNPNLRADAVPSPKKVFRNFKTLHIDIFLDATPYIGALLQIRVSGRRSGRAK